MSSRLYMNDWISEYCSPVVGIITTSEAENICLKNGLLMHDLLNSFGHLTSVNAMIRVQGSPNLALQDAHIRFEKSTEMKEKTAANLEELLKSSFGSCNINELPRNIEDLKASPTSIWNMKIDQLLTMRSLSFSEYEMLSNPIVIMNVVASNEADPVLAMHELFSSHYTPPGFISGQYDGEIHKVFIVLHDVAECKHIDSASVLKRLQSKFPVSQTKLLKINSLSQEQQNLQQPDMWSKYCVPLCFPDSLPQQNKDVLFNTESIVLGSRLSIDDFMILRNFCVSLFLTDIVPQLERRIAALTRVVTENRKGVRNVLKSFWRKPREEAIPSKPGNSNIATTRYRYDRIESQILLLADTSFIIKDYETAISMYKLVRDDFKADRSNFHLCHTYLMTAFSYISYEPHKTREVMQNLEALAQLLIAPSEPVHVMVYFAILATDIYTSKDYRQYVEAAQLLLIVASHVARYPIISTLLTEKAAGYYLLGNYSRRYILHEVLVGHKLRNIGGTAGKYAIMSFASALLLHEQTYWGDIKSKLFRAIAMEFKNTSPERAYVALLHALYILTNKTAASTNVKSQDSFNDAIVILDELMNGNYFALPSIIDESWKRLTVHDILLSPIPVSLNANGNSTVIIDFPIPDIHFPKVSLMLPFNGISTLVPWSGRFSSHRYLIQAEEMKLMSEIEKSWIDNMNERSNINSKSIRTLGELWVEGQVELASRLSRQLERNFCSFASLSLSSLSNKFSNNSIIAQFPVGEIITLRIPIQNQLPTALNIFKFEIDIEPKDSFEIITMDVSLNPNESKDVYAKLKPLKPGTFHISRIQYRLSDYLSIKKNINKLGSLLHKTQKQRIERIRSEDVSLKFEVVDVFPLLETTFTEIPDELLQGQLFNSTFILRNVGTATAKNIILKLSQPCMIFIKGSIKAMNSSQDLLDMFGQSATLVQLPLDVMIPSGKEFRIEVWMRLVTTGKQMISVMSIYQSNDIPKETHGKSMGSRNSFIAFETRVIPAIGLVIRSKSDPTNMKNKFLMVELTNNLPDPSNNSSNTSTEVAGNLCRDGCFMIDGIELFGSCKSNNEYNNKYASLWKELQIKSLERVSIPVGIEVISEMSEEIVYNRLVNSKSLPNMNLQQAKRLKQLQGCKSWAIPLSSSNQTSDNTDRIIERFICTSTCSKQFQKDIKFAEYQSYLQANDQEAPRTISQVRKDRQKDIIDVNNEYQYEGYNENDSNNLEILQNILRGYASNAKELAIMEARHKTVGIAVIWKCNWKGSIRTGVHYLPSISLRQIPHNMLTSIPTMRGIVKSTADNILVNLEHMTMASLNHSSGNSLQSVLVPMNVHIMSICDEPLFVNIEVVYRRDKKEVSASGTSTFLSSDDSFLAVAKSSCRGLQWQGQTKYYNVPIDPFQKISLPFYALISKSGVFDLKRLKIGVGRLNEDFIDKQISFKELPGQSLIEVS